MARSLTSILLYGVIVLVSARPLAAQKITLADGATPTTPSEPCIQNFDGVSAPALPSDWVATNPNPGDGTLWVTSIVTPDSPPNDAFIPDQAGISDKVLETMNITVTSALEALSFRNNFNTEVSGGIFRDGGVLEVSSPNVNGGAFTDIIDPAAGASFALGGYTGTIDPTSGNPLAGRMAWSGDSGGYIDTLVYFGSNLNGQTIKLRFRMGTDEAGAAPGWRIDTVITVALCSGPTPTATATATATATPTPSATPVATPTPAGNGKIAFTSLRDGNGEIYAMDPDGSNQINLTNDPGFDFQPAWSPDGTKLLFSSSRKGDDEIYLMDANGSNPIRLTSNPGFDLAPRWSPDGAKIAFFSGRDGNSEIYVMDANGSNPIRLTNNDAGDFSPSWSPDGTKIVFYSDRDSNYQIYVMDANGSNQARLTQNSADDASPAWSPDGFKIAFTSNRIGDRKEIYVMDANGLNQVPLTNQFENVSPAWSPDGTKIVFTRYLASDEIFVMEADGSNQTRLTKNTTEDSDPTWQWVLASPSPSPTPTPSPARALNISTRMRVATGNSVLIGGFIVTGNAPKNVAVRGIGPSLAQFGVADALADPTLELHNSGGLLLAQNDNWQDDLSQAAQLTALGLELQHPNESGIVALLQPGAYTTILAGQSGTTGVGLVEIYDANQAASSQLANISTRGFVLTADSVMIGGFILGGNHDTHVALRGIGPSLASTGLSPVLADPTLELHDGNGAVLVSNDNWQDDPVSAAQLTALGLAPQNQVESGISVSLPPGAFTAILAGKNNGTGIGLVEVYNVGEQ